MALYAGDGCPVVRHLLNSDGLKLCCYTWRSSSWHGGLIIFIHGVQSHARFELLTQPELNTTAYQGSWVSALNGRGWSVCGLDLQGHGLSDGWMGKRGNVQFFDQYAADVLLLLESLQEWIRPTTVYLMGISMGACVCIRAIQMLSLQKTQPSLTPSGVVLLSSMLSIEKIKSRPLSRLLLRLSRPLYYLTPHLPITAIEPNVLYPIIDELKLHDPLTNKHPVPVRLSFECVQAIEKAHSGGWPAGLGMLMVHTAHDGMCEVEGARKFFEKLPLQIGEHGGKKWFEEIEGGGSLWHYITMEEGSRQILDKVMHWLDLQQSKLAKL
eukprot:GHVS01067814.1.p1 GENE.GHVS01067814.1~~GHVS01067814.1.p1  ORF type:complete len:325 (+),score=39.10 GHVS01067814.1:201-1175(+)